MIFFTFQMYSNYYFDAFTCNHIRKNTMQSIVFNKRGIKINFESYYSLDESKSLTSAVEEKLVN